jgi:protein O-mannosyl-transferase
LSPRRSNFVCSVLIVAAGLCAYHNALHGPFVFDDYPAVLQNPEIRSLGASLRPTAEYTAGRPVAVFTLYLNYITGGLNPFGYHIGNIAIHLLTALTLFGLVRRTLVSSTLARNFRGMSTQIALISALLFVTHPVTTEVVNYVLQRTESLMALMALLTLYFLNQALMSPRPRIYFVLSVLACALGMGCKQVMVVIPLVAFLYDRIFFCDSWSQPLRRRWKFYLALAATWNVLLVAQLLRRQYESVGMTVAGITPWTYLLTESAVLSHYLRLIFWPNPLVIDYFDWRPAWSLAKVWPYGLFILALLALSLGGLLRGRPAGFVGMAIFLVLAPTSSILPLPSEFAAERRIYLPLALFLPMIVATFFLLMRRAIGSSAALVSPAICAAIMVLFISLCIARNRDYATDEALWRDTVEKRPTNARAWANYADVLYRENHFDEAASANKTAIDLDSSLPAPHQNLGSILARAGDYEGAMREFQTAVRVHDDAKSHALLANAYAHLGRNQDAVAEFRRAVQMDPRDPALHDACGFVLAKIGRTRDAIAEFSQAIALDPHMTGAYFDLALAQEAEGDWRGAVKNLRIALAHDPQKILVLRTLAWALAVSPDPAVANAPEAIQLAEKAAGANADDAQVLDTLAAAYARAGQFDRALATATRAASAAEKDGDGNLAAVIRARMGMYRNHQPFIQPYPATRSKTQTHVSYGPGWNLASETNTARTAVAKHGARELHQIRTMSAFL